ncbi:uncharacterized protein VTP21DRAFT_3461 [Calcarisporiella thermophila]|uniref:uncharacterized protein n=1 Tax=Calcarisporiella thermophila TaxID=911321 RepID=UPI00374484C7
MSKDTILFSDVFDVKDIDRDGKFFDRCSRINARSENYEMDLTMDINSEIYPLDIGDKFSLVLASSLEVDASSATKSQSDVLYDVIGDKRTLASDYEYVVLGKCFKYDEGQGNKVSVLISYGGLLVCLEGDFRHLQNLTVGENIYILIRK